MCAGSMIVKVLPELGTLSAKMYPPVCLTIP
jgi:hypothetical protein